MRGLILSQSSTAVESPGTVSNLCKDPSVQEVLARMALLLKPQQKPGGGGLSFQANTTPLKKGVCGRPNLDIRSRDHHATAVLPSFSRSGFPN